MSETAGASTSVSRAGGGGKAKSGRQKKPKTPSVHPKYMEMSVAAINALNERNGSSRQAILKYIMSNYNVGKDNKVVNTHLKMALKRGVTSGILKHAKGQGASGSFRVSEKPAGAAGKGGRKKVEKAKKSPAAEKSRAEKAKAVKAAKPKQQKKKPTAASKAKKEKKPKSPKKVVEKKRVKAKKPKSPKKAGEKKRATAKPKMKSPKKGKK